MTPTKQSYPTSSVRYSQLPAMGGHYFVGSDGSVFKLTELKQGFNKKRTHSYYIVSLFDEEGRTYSATVHSLIARCFIGPRPQGLFIDHIDGNTFNNDISNLEYVTPAENVRRAFASGRRKINHAQMKKMSDANRGQRSKNRKFSDDQAYQIISDYKSGKYTMKELGKVHGCAPSSVARIVYGTTAYKYLKRVNAPTVRAKEISRGIEQ